MNHSSHGLIFVVHHVMTVIPFIDCERISLRQVLLSFPFFFFLYYRHDSLHSYLSFFFFFSLVSVKTERDGERARREMRSQGWQPYFLGR
jgi:hypothetical protein